MLAVLACGALARPPTLFVPPMLGTQLHGRVSGLNTGFWYCESSLDDTVLWVNEEYVLPPLINCLADWLRLEWDEKAQTLVNRTNTSIFVTDWGGESGFRWVDTGVFGVPLVPSLVHILDYFHNQGYVAKQDLWGAPYDWRLVPAFLDDFFNQLKYLIEDIYSRNAKQRVALFACSAGGFMTYLFLTRIVTQEWKDQYIDRVVFANGAQGGSVKAAMAAWTHTYDVLPDLLVTDSVKKFIVSAPVMYGEFPNFNIFSNAPIAVGPDGRNYSSQEFLQLLKEYKKLPEIGEKILQRTMPYLTDPISDPGVNAYLVFNSGLQMPRTLRFDKGFNASFTVVTGPGDGTVHKESHEHMCGSWTNAAKQGKTVVCHDLATANEAFDHMGTLSQKEFITIVYRAMTGDDWLIGGNHNVTGLNPINWTA
jgi:lecithin-cholesterol acyltransferase